MLNQLSDSVRVLNLDQTWINEGNFTRRKWLMRGQVNTLADKQINPRIAMQMAICSEGKLYYSLAQVNTDSRVFCLFISHLAKRLTAED